jgi:signal transduction histidine kinase
VRLQVDHGPDRDAHWIQHGLDPVGTSTARIPIVHGAQPLGSLIVVMPAGRPLRAKDHRLLADLADQAGLGFHNARLSAELAGQVEQLRRHTIHLAESRRRLITAGDAERSRLERAVADEVLLHVGQLPDRLRHLAVGSQPGGQELGASLTPLIDSLTSAVEALREITRGVFPAQLTRSGLPSAVGSLLARPSNRGRMVVGAEMGGRRFDPGVEAAVYFCIAEAARELEHPVMVRLGVREDHLNAVLTGANPTRGLSVLNMRDRVEAVGGSIGVRADAGDTTITVDVPLHPPDVEASSRTGLRAASTL